MKTGRQMPATTDQVPPATTLFYPPGPSITYSTEFPTTSLSTTLPDTHTHPGFLSTGHLHTLLPTSLRTPTLPGRQEQRLAAAHPQLLFPHHGLPHDFFHRYCQRHFTSSHAHIQVKSQDNQLQRLTNNCYMQPLFSYNSLSTNSSNVTTNVTSLPVHTLTLPLPLTHPMQESK